MNKRIALIGIVVENHASVEKLNAILHEYGPYVLGRMGLPHQRQGISLISVAVDAPEKEISALAGKLGMLPGVNSKTIYSKLSAGEEPC